MSWRSVHRVGLRATQAALVGASTTLAALGGCFVTVDEGLLRRDAGPLVDVSADARVEDAGSNEGGVRDASDATAPYRGMACGGDRCLPPGKICCTGGDGDPDPSRGHCDTESNCQSGDFWQCMGPSDCTHAGRPPVCCAVDFKGGGFSKATCQTACASDATELCEPSEGSCPAPRECQPSTAYPGLFACQ